MVTVDLFENRSNLSDVVRQSVDTLELGGVLVYPTDTVYGYGCDATKSRPVKKINSLKSREGKAYSVIMRDLEMAKRYCRISKKNEKIFNKLLPGRFTLIFKAKDKRLRYVAAEDGTIGVRIPDYELTSLVSADFYKPYVTTSVNKSGEEPEVVGVNIKLKYIEQDETPDLLVDAGRLGEKENPPLPSSVIDLSGKEPRIVRAGGMNTGDILKMIYG